MMSTEEVAFPIFCRFWGYLCGLAAPMRHTFWLYQRSIAASGSKSLLSGPSSPILKLFSNLSQLNRLRQSFLTLFIQLNILSSFALIVGVINSNSITCTSFPYNFLNCEVNNCSHTSRYFTVRLPDINWLISSFNKSHSGRILSRSHPLSWSKAEKCADNSLICDSPNSDKLASSFGHLRMWMFLTTGCYWRFSNLLLIAEVKLSIISLYEFLFCSLLALKLRSLIPWYLCSPSSWTTSFRNLV